MFTPKSLGLRNVPSVRLPRRLLGHHPVEDQLHPVRPPQIQIVANDFLEELASLVVTQSCDGCLTECCKPGSEFTVRVRTARPPQGDPPQRGSRRHLQTLHRLVVADTGDQQNPLLPGITPTLALGLHWCVGSGRLISRGAYPGIGASGIPYKVIRLSYPAHAL